MSLSIQRVLALFKRPEDVMDLAKKQSVFFACSAFWSLGTLCYQKFTFDKNKVCDLKKPDSFKKTDPKVRSAIGKIQKLASKMNLTENIQISFNKEQSYFSSFSKLPVFFSSAICIGDVKDLSDGEVEFLACRQLVCIKNRYYWRRFSIPLVVHLIINIAVDIIFPEIALFYSLLVMLCSFITFIYVHSSFERYYEKNIDIETVKILGTKQAALDHFKKQIEKNLHKRKNGEQNITPHGEDEADLSHPPLAQRRRYIQKLQLA